MPELPEVYTIVKYLQKKITGEILQNLWTDTPKIFGGEKNFQKISVKLKNKKINSVARIGKNILFNFADGAVLIAHQKMTGHFLVGQWIKIRKEGKTIWLPNEKRLNHQEFLILQNPSNRFIHLVIEFKSGKMLVLSDMRKFARIEMSPSSQITSSHSLKNLGPDWWDNPLTPKGFYAKLQGSKKKIKSFLLNQNIAAGLGNIYVDESLFEGKINPLRHANSLNLKEAKRILKAIKIILGRAIKMGGTSFSDYRQANGKKGTYQNLLKVYGRKGEKCLNCRQTLIGIKIGQRATVYCRQCQKEIISD
jgi:formamidopyrimidine-DNA glycosylase